MPYGVVCRTFLPIRFLPLNPRFRQTSLLPAPTQYFEQLATACKTQLDHGSLLRHEIPANFGDRFYFVSLPKKDWRRQRRRKATPLVFHIGFPLREKTYAEQSSAILSPIISHRVADCQSASVFFSPCIKPSSSVDETSPPISLLSHIIRLQLTSPLSSCPL